MKKNTNKRKFSLVIFIFMILMMILPMNVSAITKAKIELNGNGSPGEPYEITNMNELFEFNEITRTKPWVCAKVTRSITINQGGFNGRKFILGYGGRRKRWEPIGTKENPYTGEFIVENGCEINGLYINSKDCAGLFGYIGRGAVISRVRLNHSEILGRDYVGGVCGSNNGGTIKSCNINNSKVKGTSGINKSKVRGTSVYVGGVCGSNNGGTIEFCNINNSEVTGSSRSEYTEGVGGVCGINNNNAVITDCNVFAINVIGNTVGGVCGTNEDGGKIEKCKTSANVEGFCAGGVCGKNGGGPKKSSIELCEFKNASVRGYWTGGVCGTNEVGGLITLCTVDASGIIGRFIDYNTGVVCGKDATGVSVENCAVLNGDAAICRGINCEGIVWDASCWIYEDYRAKTMSVGRVESGGNDGIIRNPQIINIADSSDRDVIIVEPTVEQAKMGDSDVIIVEPTAEQAKMGDRDVIIVEPTVEHAKMGDRDETMTKTIESTGMVEMSAGNEAAKDQYDLNDENPSAADEVDGLAKSGVRRTAGMFEKVSKYESPNKRVRYQWDMDDKL